MKLNHQDLFILNSILKSVCSEKEAKKEQEELKKLIQKLLSEDTDQQKQAFEELQSHPMLSGADSNPSQFKHYFVFLLGLCFNSGIGIDLNQRKAFEIYKTIEISNSFAMALLADLYQSGDGGELDTKKASLLNLKAAKIGNAIAQYNLGHMFDEGVEFEKDIYKAFSWYLESARQGYPHAQYNAATMLVSGHEVETDYTLAAAFFEKLLSYHHDAAFNLGILYFEGKGVIKDLKRALELFTISANKNDMTTQHYLAQIYYNGLGGVPKDPIKARHWYLKAAENGHAASQFKYAGMCVKGEGGDKQVLTGTEWLQKASLQGILAADFNLSNLRGSLIDSPEANTALFNLMQHSAKEGFAWAQANLAWRYENHRVLTLRLEEAEYLHILNEFGCKALNCRDCHKEFQLNGKGITGLWTQSMAELLSTNRKLESLALDGNPLGDVGATALANMLDLNGTIKNLSLGSCSITDKGLHAFSNTLSINSNLENLALWGNDFSCKGICALFNSLKRNPNSALRGLWLAANNLNLEVLTELAALLKRNTSLCSVTLGHKDGMNITLGGKQRVAPVNRVKEILKDAKEVDETQLKALLNNITQKLLANQKTKRKAILASAPRPRRSRTTATNEDVKGRTEARTTSAAASAVATAAATPSTPKPRPKLTIDTKLAEDAPVLPLASSKAAGTPIVFSKEFTNPAPLLAAVPLKKTKSVEKENLQPTATVSGVI